MMMSKLLVSEDEETVSHACWSLSHVIDGPSSPFNENVKPQMTVARCEDLTKPLLLLLDSPSWRITKPALRVLGNIVCSDGVVSA
jgi:importin subunit alpha-1